VSVAERQAPGKRRPGTAPAESSGEYPGQRLGLPRSGPGSVAGIGRRLGALLIDWAACAVIATAVLGGDKDLAKVQYLTLAIFAAETYVLTALTGYTLGKRLLSLRVARLDGKPVGPVWGLVRTALFLCVIPPLIFDGDLRGLHDQAANTVVIRTEPTSAGKLSTTGVIHRPAETRCRFASPPAQTRAHERTTLR
jgi:uncharacterized RDD family membrane protein YckC